MTNQHFRSTPDTLAALVLQRIDEAAAAGKALNAVPRASIGERMAWQCALTQVHEQTAELQHQLAIAFGERYGWRLSDSNFGLNTLARGKVHSGSRQDDAGNGFWPGRLHYLFDHPFYYRRERQAAAIAAHLYDYPHCRRKCEAAAEEYGLRCEAVADFPSWWYPGQTTLVLYRAL